MHIMYKVVWIKIFLKYNGNLNDLINDNIKELKESKKEYKKRMKNIKAESFLGVKTLITLVLTTEANSIGKMPDEIINRIEFCWS